VSNSLLTTDLILDRALAVLSESPVFLDKINRQYDGKFASKGVKVGDTVSVKVPMRATIRDGRVMAIQDQVDRTIPVAIDKYKGVDTGATSLEMSMDIDSYQASFIDTKIPDLVAAVEADALATVVPLVYHTAGDFGLFNDVSTVLAAGGILDNNLAPRSNRYMLCNVAGQQQMVNALTGFYNPASNISEQYREGLMARNTLGFDWYQSTLLSSRTRGSANTAAETVGSATGLTSDLATDISTIDIDTGSGTWAAGDIFTIEGVNAVHPQTKADLGYLKQFVVRTASAGGTVTLSFSPAIVSSGPGQNVSAAPAVNKDVLPLGTASTAYAQSLAFHKDAFYFVTADLPKPEGMGVQVSQKTYKGITLRFMNGFDITNDMYVSRFDIAYGVGVLRPELACRIQHTP
jgi:hypothetical protein